MSKASRDVIGKEVPRNTISQSLRGHNLLRSGYPKATLIPLKDKEFHFMTEELEGNPALNVEDWARIHGIIPYHAAACVTEGALNAYGRARLKGETKFQHLNDENVKALKAHLENHDRDIERWAIDNGIFPYEIKACVAEDGTLSDLGEARWDLAMYRTKPGAQSKKIDPSAIGPEAYRTLRREVIKRLELGLGSNAVADETGIPESTVRFWRQQPPDEAAVGKPRDKPCPVPFLNPTEVAELKAAFEGKNPADFGSNTGLWTQCAAGGLFAEVFPHKPKISLSTAFKYLKFFVPSHQRRTLKRKAPPIEATAAPGTSTPARP